MKTMKKAIEPTEDSEQEALFEWAAYASGKYPELTLMHAIPNGGKRHIHTAVVLKKTGVKSGVPDIFLPVARKGKHGLYVEMKRLKSGSISANQKEWIAELTAQGYECVVCRGWVAAKKEIIEYIKEERGLS